MEKFIEIRPKIQINKIKHRISISHALKITGVIKLVHAVTTQPDSIKSIMPSRRKLLSKTKKSLFEWEINKRTLLQRKSNEKSMKMNENHGISDSMSVLTFRRNFFVFETNFLRDGIILFIKSGYVVTA